jgi:hypothetical protein
MSRHAIAPMILTAALLAVPALAATDATSGSSPAATRPAASSPAATAPAPNNMSAGMPASHSASSSTPMAGASTTAEKTPEYTTADGQIRLGKVVGASVYNDQNQSIGSVDDVLMSKDGKATTAVLSVGGFLGMDSKLVSVPIDQLKVHADKVMMPGATKASLEQMPSYKFNA